MPTATIERKSYPILGLKADDASGEICAIVSVFNNIDSGKEVVRPGFFTKSIEKKLPKGVWAHDWKQPIAKTLEAKELLPGDPMLPDDLKELGGTYIKGQFNLETQRGREAYSDIKFGIVDEFSIGYKVTKESKDDKTGARELLEGDWKEWSPVLVGMNDRTALLSIKSDEPIEDEAEWMKSYTEKALERIEKSDLEDAVKTSATEKIKAAAKELGVKIDEPIQKGMLDDAIQEREDSVYFLSEMLQTAIWRAEMLAESDPNFNMAEAVHGITADLDARLIAALVGTDNSGAELASLREPISFKGDLRAGSTFAKTTETALAAVEVFAQRSAAISEFLTEFNKRSAAIMETRFKDGRMYSSTNLSQMRRVHESVGKLRKDVKTIHSDMADLIQRAQKPEKSESNSLRTQSLKARSMALMALNS